MYLFISEKGVRVTQNELLKELENKDLRISELTEQLNNIQVKNISRDNFITEDNKCLISIDLLEIIEEGEKRITDMAAEIDRLSAVVEKNEIIFDGIEVISKGLNMPVGLRDKEAIQYFTQLSSIASNNNYQEQYLPNTESFKPVMFHDKDTIPVDSNDTFSVDRKKLYSHFDLEYYPYKSVLVKWYKEGSETPILFRYFNINTYSSENHIWINNNDGWGGGQYNIEIYSADELPQLLSAGSYQISSELE